MDRKYAHLILSDGQVFTGCRFGAKSDITAELVFTTNMGGYLETLTDPSYHGQMVVQTFPLIGNYGFIPEDQESDRPWLLAYIVHDLCDQPSNFRSQGTLGDYLAACGVIGLYGMDTRALTKTIRDYGVVNAAICSELPKEFGAFVHALKTADLCASVLEVSTKTPQVFNSGGKPHIALWDFGYKRAMAKALIDRGCKVTVIPADTTCEQILRLDPDGLMLSNGPGDPAVNESIIENLKKVIQTSLPIFGICLGHQLLALATGAKTAKLKYGHRGSNQPVRDTKTGRLYITSQNHGYAVVNDTMPKTATLRFENLNDLTSEGIDYADFPGFSVQFHPEACAGPLDTSFLFDRFLAMVGGDSVASQ